jgi:hypothetical protein
MAEGLNLPENVVDEFATQDPSEKEVDRVKKILKHLPNDPAIGSPIPFDLPEFRGCFVTWTPDKQWRIVFQRKNPSGVTVLSIAREES